MTEPVDRRTASMSNLFGRGEESLEDYESDESLDLEEARANDDRKEGPELAHDYGLTEVDASEEETLPAEEEDEPNLLERVEQSLGEEEEDGFQITEREHELEVQNATLKARQEAAEANILPEADEPASEAINYVSPEIVAALAEKFDIDPSKAQDMASTIGTFAEAAAKNLYGSQLESLEKNQVDSAQVGQQQQAYAEVQRNLESGFSEAEEYGELEASIARDWQQRSEDSYLYAHFQRNPHSLTTPEGVTNAIRLVASDLRELDALNQELGEESEAEGEGADTSQETATYPLVGRRSEVNATMNRAIRRGAETSSNPQESEEDAIFREILEERSGTDRLGSFFD